MAEMRKPEAQFGGMVTGMFRDRDSAERAYQAMSSRGYTRDDINVMMSEEARKRHFADDARQTELGTKAAEGAGVGAAVGGTLGAALGVAAAVGAIALPGIGLIALGPVAAGLAGAGAGGVTGGLVGALVGSGIPEDRAKLYEGGLKQGGILMGVRPRSPEDADYFEREWRSYRGENIYR
ncbi:MAG TPA: hypothetical protein VFQ62_19780 [Methylomirabilota bacterium]|nr:hypothetical protein [Methylomirabilota bacterium]